MSKYVIDDTTLTAIADAVREKGGTAEKIKVSGLPDAIAEIETGSGGGEGPTAEELTFSGVLDYWNYYGQWDSIIAKYNNLISFNNISSAKQMFQYSKSEDYSNLTIESLSSSFDTTGMFRECTKLKVLPQTKLYSRLIQYLFRSCYALREIPDDYFTDWDLASIAIGSGVFMDCYSLRKIPASFLGINSAQFTSYSGFPYYQLAYNCYTLDEITDLPNFQAKTNMTLTNSMFVMSFQNCNRLKNLTFQMEEDGSPMMANWKNQIIDLSSFTGYGTQVNNITGYNSGITADKQVTNDKTYAALKDDPDWFTIDIAYSRYNHDSAVRTINSLPDTSAYLATAGGTNTIKFKGEAGSATDGGAINTLTEEEIAVATAKGWTVTLV